MRRAISRNIALVSAIFIVVFSTMLITNYFQVSGSQTIQSELLEGLRQINEESGGNLQLQEQIRELDLLARKAYFISLNRLRTGVVILLVMVVAFAVSLQVYFAKSRDIPDKEIDPIDDWLTKSRTRKYIVRSAGALAVCGLLFAILTSPYMRTERSETVAYADEYEYESQMPEEALAMTAEPESQSIASDPETTETVAAADTIQVSRVTHNAFRGNNSLGHSSATKIPTSWDPASGRNILWRVPVSRQGYNSPVINGNRVFFTGADEEARELYCYDLTTGKELWRLAARNIPGSPAQVPETTDDTGLAASPVATDGVRVCAIYATGDVICADMDGNRLWAKNIGVPSNRYGYASSLLIFGNSLIIQYDNSNSPRVISLDLETGNQRWVRERPQKIAWSSPIIAYVNRRPQLILMGDPNIISYNPNTGEENWRVECMLSGEAATSPAFSNGVVYAASEYAVIIAIDAETGTVLWRDNDILPDTSSPVATPNDVFVATHYGLFARYDAKTGEITKTMELNSEFYASPMIVEGKIYLVGTDGRVFILSARSDFSLINSFDTGERTYATPAFTDNKIVIKTEDSIYCVSSL